MRNAVALGFGLWSHWQLWRLWDRSSPDVEVWAFFHVYQQRTTFVAAGVLYTLEICQDATVADLGHDRQIPSFLSNQKGWNDSIKSFLKGWKKTFENDRMVWARAPSVGTSDGARERERDPMRLRKKERVMKQGSNGTTSVSGYFLAVANSCLLLFGHQRQRRTVPISGEAPHALLIAPSNLPQFTTKISWRSLRCPQERDQFEKTLHLPTIMGYSLVFTG